MHVLKIPTIYHVAALLPGNAWPGLGKGDRTERQGEGLTNTRNCSTADGK